MNPTHPPPLAALPATLLLLPGTSLMTFASTLDPMRAANRVAGRAVFEWRLVSADGEPVHTTCGVSVPVEGALEPARVTGLLLVVAGFHAREQASRTLIRGIRQSANNARRVVGVEAGAWLLAQAGLLDGRRATTHWEDLEDFASRYPSVRVCPDRYVIDGPVATAGGASPMFDLMLHLVRERCGPATALDVAGVFSYDEARAGTEAQPRASLGRVERHEPRVAEAIRRMELTLDAPVDIPSLASSLGISTRTLENLFRETVGTSPARFALGLRLNAARRLVVDTRLPLAEVAVRTGFSSGSAFSRAFRRNFGISAMAMRGGARPLHGRAQ